MNVKLLTEHHLEFLSLKGGYTGSSESTLVKMPHCLKSHVTAHLVITLSLVSYMHRAKHKIFIFALFLSNLVYLSKIKSEYDQENRKPRIYCYRTNLIL